MTAAVLAVLACAGAAALLMPEPAPGRRLQRALTGPGLPAAGARSAGAAGAAGLFNRPSARITVGAAAGLATAFLFGAQEGLLVGLCCGALADPVGSRLRRRRERAGRRRRLYADLPAAADLLAGCLDAGCPPAEAAAAVATTVRGPVGEALERTASLLELGAEPTAAWLQLADDPELAPLGRAFARAVDSGAPLADAASAVADDVRSAGLARAAEEARRVAVRAVAPLGLCFLPAFLLLGVVPVVVGIASTVWGRVG